MTTLILVSLLATTQPNAATTPQPTALQQAPAATAQLNDMTRLERRLPGKRWYGWQILLADGAALASTVGLAYAGQEGAAQVAAISLSITGPVVHWINGNIGRGFGSLGIRAGIPTSGFIVGLFAGAMMTGNPYGAIAFAALGFLVGGTAAIAVDVSALAWKERDSIVAPHSMGRSRWSLVPSAWSSSQGTTQYGLVGTF